MEEKTLYRVDAQFSYYVLAADEIDATVFAYQAAEEGILITKTKLVRPWDEKANDWDDDSRVYGTMTDTRLCEVWPTEEQQ